MKPEQVPGTLFVLLLALVAWMISAPVGLLLLAAGCACGWVFQTDSDNGAVSGAAFAGAMLFWTAAFVYLSWKVLL